MVRWMPTSGWSKPTHVSQRWASGSGGNEEAVSDLSTRQFLAPYLRNVGCQ